MSDLTDYDPFLTRPPLCGDDFRGNEYLWNPFLREWWFYAAPPTPANGPKVV